MTALGVEADRGRKILEDATARCERDVNELRTAASVGVVAQFVSMAAPR